MHYNHLCTFAFTVISTNTADELSANELKKAATQRHVEIDQGRMWIEACLPPIDSEPIFTREEELQRAIASIVSSSDANCGDSLANAINTARNLIERP